MLSGHSLLVAAIFVPSVVMMGALFTYICWTGYHREKDSSDEEERDRERAEMGLAA